MYRIKYTDRFLIAQVALYRWSVQKVTSGDNLIHQEHVNGDLLSLVLEIVDVGSGHTFCSVTQNACFRSKYISPVSFTE